MGTDPITGILAVAGIILGVVFVFAVGCLAIAYRNTKKQGRTP